MTRRPQVLRVTDSLKTSRRPPPSSSSTTTTTTSSERQRAASTHEDATSPSPRSSQSPQYSYSPQPDYGADSPQEEHAERTYVSQSSLRLRPAGSVTSPAHDLQGYDEYLCADHRWTGRRHSLTRSQSAAGSPTTSPVDSDADEDTGYVTWTKSSLRSKQWQLLHSPAANTATTITASPGDMLPAASRILKEDDGDDLAAEGCVAVLAPCPGASPAVSLVTMATSTATRTPSRTPSSSSSTGQHQRGEFDGLLQYLQDYRHGLRELLVNNNVVIIEPVRASQAKRAAANKANKAMRAAAKRHQDDRRAHSAPAEHTDGPDDPKGCRITGAIVKASDSDGRSSAVSNNTLPRSQKPHQPILRRQFFYHPIKINKELVDAELPDPDTVRNARKVFEQRAALRPAVKQARNAGGAGGGLDGLRCWTDSGSLSSGVSSDLSCCDTSCDTDLPTTCSSHSGSQREVFSSGDESETDQQQHHQKRDGGAPTMTAHPAVSTTTACSEADGNPVSEAILQKIRACGTSVTYFGGQVLACTNAGPARSPMTMAIMEEIRRSARPLGSALGIKFRLVKSNSCGSRLELAGQPGRRFREPRAAPSAAPTPPADSPTSTSTPPPATNPDTAVGASPATADQHPIASSSTPDRGSPTSTATTTRVRTTTTTPAAQTQVKNEMSTVQDDPLTAEDKLPVIQPPDAKIKHSVKDILPVMDNFPVKDKLPDVVENLPVLKPVAAANGGGGVEDNKENRPVVATNASSWRLSSRLALDDHAKRPTLPPPQPLDKFGIMEFEEFQFIES